MRPSPAHAGLRTWIALVLSVLILGALALRLHVVWQRTAQEPDQVALRLAGDEIGYEALAYALLQVVSLRIAEAAQHVGGPATPPDRLGGAGVLSRPASNSAAGTARRGVCLFHACPHDHLGRDALQRAAAPAAGDDPRDSRQRGSRPVQTPTREGLASDLGRADHSANHTLEVSHGKPRQLHTGGEFPIAPPTGCPARRHCPSLMR
jgi:hypothetical protein